MALSNFLILLGSGRIADRVTQASFRASVNLRARREAYRYHPSIACRRFQVFVFLLPYFHININSIKSQLTQFVVDQYTFLMKSAPITVKSYGLIEFTKKQYLLTQLGVFVLGFPLIAATNFFTSQIGPATFLVWPFIIVAAIAFVGELVETIVMLVLFHRKEHAFSQDTPTR